ncbi:hypothetical protein [Arsenophonus endosymbiont of Apis mellifera]|uniref:hypothetical protein n=1 Tax=Arsenophonus endosymbiont of Apis mellifera TaxID=1541805 RepID=UPI0015D8C78D|nr:hypothetical protein [Arsenophonus endosymbiont of Apis mellifera]
MRKLIIFIATLLLTFPVFSHDITINSDTIVSKKLDILTNQIKQLNLQIQSLKKQVYATPFCYDFENGKISIGAKINDSKYQSFQFTNNYTCVYKDGFGQLMNSKELND